MKRILRDVLGGFLLALVMWMPMPKSVVFPRWSAVVAVIVLIAAWLWAIYKDAFRPMDAKTARWRGAGFLIAGILFSCIPVPDSIRTGTDPVVFIVVGVIAVCASLVAAWLGQKKKKES